MRYQTPENFCADLNRWCKKFTSKCYKPRALINSNKSEKNSKILLLLRQELSAVWSSYNFFNGFEISLKFRIFPIPLINFNFNFKHILASMTTSWKTLEINAPKLAQKNLFCTCLSLIFGQRQWVGIIKWPKSLHSIEYMQTCLLHPYMVN